MHLVSVVYLTLHLLKALKIICQQEVVPNLKALCNSSRDAEYGGVFNDVFTVLKREEESNGDQWKRSC